jgi:hypothetical protein
MFSFKDTTRDCALELNLSRLFLGRDLPVLQRMSDIAEVLGTESILTLGLIRFLMRK